MSHLKTSHRGGFTLVEVLIVVVILGILAATVLPQFTSSTEEANQAALDRNLQTIRSQIQMFRFQHNGILPGNGGNDFVEQMTKRTNIDGNVDETNGQFGPYILGEFPANPFDKKRDIAATRNYTGGWFFDRTTGEFDRNDAGANPANE